jgi:hypothetical protein
VASLIESEQLAIIVNLNPNITKVKKDLINVRLFTFVSV